MSIALTKPTDKTVNVPTESVTSLSGVPPLGEPVAAKRFWWQRTKSHDANTIATLVRFPAQVLFGLA
jgi:hypothetical protein